MSMASDRPQRQIRKSTQNTDYLYSFPPVNAKQRKNEQHKKNRKKRLNQEVIHWDLRLKFPDVDQLDGSPSSSAMWAGDDEPHDAQFITSRLPAWKRLLKLEYPSGLWEEKERVTQLKIKGYVSIMLYSSGKVMVQGPKFKEWAEGEFPRLKEMLDGGLSPKNQELSQARALTPVASDDSDTSSVSSDRPKSSTRRISHMSTLRHLARSFSRMFNNKQSDDDTDRNPSAPGCISVATSTPHTDNRLHQVSPLQMSDLPPEPSDDNFFVPVTQELSEHLVVGTVLNGESADTHDNREHRDSVPETQPAAETSSIIQLLDNKSLDQNIPATDLLSELTYCKEALKKQEEIIEKFREDVKVLKTQSNNHKKEIRALIEQRGAAVSERELLSDENKQFKAEIEEAREECTTLTARVNTLLMQHDLCKPIPAPRKKSVATSPEKHCNPKLVLENDPPSKSKKLNLTVVGDSNMRECHKLLNNGELTSVVWLNGGAKFETMARKINNMTSSSTDAVMLHLGTNDVLNAPTNGQALLRFSKALDIVEQSVNHPVFLCGLPPLKDRKLNKVRGMVNDYFHHHCEKSSKMCFVNPANTVKHLSEDGIHLTPGAKQLLCDTVTAAAVNFHVNGLKHKK